MCLTFYGNTILNPPEGETDQQGKTFHRNTWAHSWCSENVFVVFVGSLTVIVISIIVALVSLTEYGSPPPSYSSHFHLCLFWFRRGCRVVLDLEINCFVHVLLERNAGAAVQSINRRIKKNFNRTVPRVWANEILFSWFMCFVCYFFPLSLFWRVDLMHSLFCNNWRKTESVETAIFVFLPAALLGSRQK